MHDFKIEEKIILLQELYDSADWLQKKIFFCQKGCSTCCTQSVTMSSLEGELICQYMERSANMQRFTDLLMQSENKPFRPGMTTNQFARSCIEQNEIPVAEGNWSFEPCIFLENGICGIYEVRPFSCRAFVSLSDCRQEGTASVPPVLITLNTLMHQIIEHLSVGGWWGNMLDVLPQLLMQRQAVAQKRLSRESVLLVSEKIPGLLVSEKERPVVQKNLGGIGQVLQKFSEGEIHEEVRDLQKCLAADFSQTS